MTDLQRAKLRGDAKTLRDISNLLDREFGGGSAMSRMLDGISADILDALTEEITEEGR